MTTIDSPIVTEPGVYAMDAETYHRDPVPAGSLSSSGARDLLPPSCPALFRWRRDNPQPPKREFDLGHAAHRYVLGAGADIVEIEADNYRTKQAQQDRDAAYDAGKIPLLPHEHAQVKAMAAALLEDQYGRVMFDPDRGKSEQALFWIDEETGVWCRALVDWLPNPGPGRLIIRDYKTTASANPTAVAKSCNNYRYHQQGAFYLAGAQALGLVGPDAGFLFLFQEKTPPYLVSVAQFTADDIAIGHALNRKAIEIYRDCVNADAWPGYSTEIITVRLPVWAVREYEEQL